MIGSRQLLLISTVILISEIHGLKSFIDSIQENVFSNIQRIQENIQQQTEGIRARVNQQIQEAHQHLKNHPEDGVILNQDGQKITLIKNGRSTTMWTGPASGGRSLMTQDKIINNVLCHYEQYYDIKTNKIHTVRYRVNLNDKDLTPIPISDEHDICNFI